MAVKVVEAARLLWCPGLVTLNGEPKVSIQDWISTTNYSPSVSNGDILLQGCDVHKFTEVLGANINRTTAAGSETLCNITEVVAVPKSLGWPYVKLYYAAYFYAHALLRIWGQSASFLRTLELMPIRTAFNSYNIALPFKALTGQFLLSVDRASSTVKVASDNGGGGAHESLWRAYHNALTSFRASIRSSPFLTSDKTTLDAELVSFVSLISGRGANVAWLSTIRNEIQYRQSEGVWYPYTGKLKVAALQAQVDLLRRGKLDFSQIVSSNVTGLSQFELACVAIILFSRNVLADMQAVGGSKSYLRHGQRKFEESL
ncbi:hypothetical protein [Cypionkella sp.]|uniref:hypothetical protein n=1 Tax=Cypionkella sp. TaxID=2811411 RepID=UPI002AB8B2EE|nr:hypothetical protein [Cypionkella sp.]MDZ4393100.1 hypothetical protein [Cypionkella sp.]